MISCEGMNGVMVRNAPFVLGFAPLALGAFVNNTVGKGSPLFSLVSLSGVEGESSSITPGVAEAADPFSLFARIIWALTMDHVNRTASLRE